MSNETQKISELLNTSIVSENTILPVVAAEGETNSIDIITLRSALLFDKAFETNEAGNAATSKNDSYFVYTDATKTAVLGWMNQGGDSYSPLLDINGAQIRFIAGQTIRGLDYFTNGVNSFADLRTLAPLYSGQRIKLKAWAAGEKTGGGEFIAVFGTATDDGGIIAAGNGYYWERVINGGLNPEMFGAIGNGVVDDSNSLSKFLLALANRARYLTSITFVPAIGYLNGIYRITKTITVDGGKVRLTTNTVGCIFCDPTGTYESTGCIKVTNNYLNSAFVGQYAALFENISFVTTGRTLTAIYAVRGDAASANNGACLHNVFKCSFKGFSKIFTHGPGGWGWNWVGCQFSDSTNLMVIENQDDTYERHSFDGCIFQNGGVAFTINNPDGKVYWKNGSMDYCAGAATITAGFIELNGHFEWSARTVDFITLLSSNAAASISGAMFIRNNISGSTYYVINQYQDKQVKVDNLVVISDGNYIASGVLSNKELLKGTIFAQNDASKSVLYHSSDENLISGTTSYPQVTLTNTTQFSYSVADGSLTISCSAGGQSGFLYLDVPVNNKKFYAYKMTASNTSNGSVFLEKTVLNANKDTIRTDTSSGTTSWAAGSSSVAGGTVTLLSLPAAAAFIRIRFNLSSMTTGSTFTISSLKTFTF
ncbi:hypothetical protein CENTIMANUS_00004 [Klebsiella phage vB_KpM_Centimanus]